MPQDPLTQQLVNRALPQEPDPMQALSKASTIGASRPGERYAEPQVPTTLDKIRQYLLGPARSKGVASADPYGDQAWMKGAGGPPGLMMGSTEPTLPFGGVGAAVKDGVSVGSELLKRIFAANPDAEAAYNKAMATQVPQALEARQAAGSARYGVQANAHDALLDLEHAGRPRPIPTDTGWSTAIPLKSGEKASSGSGLGAGAGSIVKSRLSNNGLTEEMIREIRALGPIRAAEQYPDINPATLRGIAMGDTYGRIK